MEAKNNENTGSSVEQEDKEHESSAPSIRDVSEVMNIVKRDGSTQKVDLNKILKSLGILSKGIPRVDAMYVATQTISGLHDGATTIELDEMSMRAAASSIILEPNYSLFASRILGTYIDKEIEGQDIHSFSQSIKVGYENDLINDDVKKFVDQNARKLNSSIVDKRTHGFEFIGLRTLYDRYLLRHPKTGKIIESPQYFFMRIASSLSRIPSEAIKFYDLMSKFEYLPSSPTLFNAGTTHSQMSSCYLLDSPKDSLEDIYDKYKDIALLSKFAGGIGVSWSRVRSQGSKIKGTNGNSNGIIPWLKTLDCSVSAVNQGGRRKGAACVYLESWHADIEDFLELRDNTGDPYRRAHNINIANWVPDLFMKRVRNNEVWSLFDPQETPDLVDLYGKDFEAAYIQAEAEGRFVRQVSSTDLFSKMVQTLAQTGNGWMTFKDSSNMKCNQTGEPKNIVHLSNLCTEILEVNNDKETSVCNLGSINLSSLVEDGEFNFDRLRENVKMVVPFLDRVIDINFYPIPEAFSSNEKWRPVGLGIMGLQDVFFKLGLNFESPEALEISTKISEEIYFAALSASCRLAEKEGKHPGFSETRIAKDEVFQFELWGVKPADMDRWEDLRKKIKKHGLRNSLLIAIAPTATISFLAGCYECIEPQVSNIFKRETLSGEFLQINKYLVGNLRDLELWNDNMVATIKANNGSIANIETIPQEIRDRYKTAWELPQKALIDLAAARGPYIDQSQSLNLFIEKPEIGKLSSMYMYAWEKGLKTTYYLRSRPATQINKVSAAQDFNPDILKTQSELACSLENPESCEACT